MVATREQPPSLRLFSPDRKAGTWPNPVSVKLTQPDRLRLVSPVSLLKAAMPASST